MVYKSEYKSLFIFVTEPNPPETFELSASQRNITVKWEDPAHFFSYFNVKVHCICNPVCTPTYSEKVKTQLAIIKDLQAGSFCTITLSTVSGDKESTSVTLYKETSEAGKTNYRTIISFPISNKIYITTTAFKFRSMFIQ